MSNKGDKSHEKAAEEVVAGVNHVKEWLHEAMQSLGSAASMVASIAGKGLPDVKDVMGSIEKTFALFNAKDIVDGLLPQRLSCYQLEPCQASGR